MRVQVGSAGVPRHDPLALRPRSPRRTPPFHHAVCRLLEEPRNPSLNLVRQCDERLNRQVLPPGLNALKVLQRHAEDVLSKMLLRLPGLRPDLRNAPADVLKNALRVLFRHLLDVRGMAC